MSSIGNATSVDPSAVARPRDTRLTPPIALGIARDALTHLRQLGREARENWFVQNHYEKYKSIVGELKETAARTLQSTADVRDANDYVAESNALAIVRGEIEAIVRQHGRVRKYYHSHNTVYGAA